MSQNRNGRIIKALSGFYYVHTAEGQTVECRARGIFRKMKMSPLVGDQVSFSMERGKGMIESIQPRKNFFIRPAVSNVDALVLVSLDSRNDFELDNIYSMGYIQTILVKPSDANKKICEKLRIDTYIALGDAINEYVYEKAQAEYGKYKILCREGFLTIIPVDSTEEDIKEYLDYLKGTDIRR